MSGTHRDAVAYADRVWHGAVSITENVPVARDTYRVSFNCPPIADPFLPGQFVMVRLANTDDPLLGRPLAVYDVTEGPGENAGRLDIVYLRVGKMTERLATMEPGRPLEVWGPLGNGFGPQESERLIMVGGGIGQTPFLTLAQECLGTRQFGDPPRQVPVIKDVTLCYGARTEEYLSCVDDFRAAGVEVRLSTDDGSAGHHGLVTDLIRPAVEEALGSCRIVCCGPEAMMKSAAGIARELEIPCQVSLESPMACGIGACFSCVTKIRDSEGNVDYRRTCVEGPVFDAREVVF
jgi:dihydroorotate dehydrogenase electron transfer subunit